MKLKSASILIGVLGCLSFSSYRAQAQSKQQNFTFALDTVSQSYRFGQPIVADTLHGTIKNVSGDSIHFIFSRTLPIQWIIAGRIGQTSSNMIIPDTFAIASGETLPVMIFIVPYPDGPDTESVCFSAQPLGTTQPVQVHCISLFLIAQSGVADAPASSAITVFPNPAENILRVAGTDALALPLSYKIFSATGTESAEGNLPANNEIDIRRLSAGAYRLELVQSGRIVTMRGFGVVR